MKNNAQTINNPTELFSHQGLRFYMPIAMLFVSLFIVVNIVTQKIVPIGWGLILTAGDFVYPLLYLLSIVLTEVYGYAMSRRVIWVSFVCNVFVAIVIVLSIHLPAADLWPEQNSYAAILGRAPRLLIASLSAFLIGEFIGTYVLAKAKIFTDGKYLWLRTLGATLIGQSIDSFIFTIIAFIGILSWYEIMILGASAYGCKVFYQVLLAPGMYSIARFLKKHEHVDIYDRNTDFNPFNLGLK